MKRDPDQANTVSEPYADLARHVPPFDPQMAEDAMHHYEAIVRDLEFLADALESRADDFRCQATDARVRAENLRDLLAEFPDGKGTQSDGLMAPCGHHDTDPLDPAASPGELSHPTQDRAAPSDHSDGDGCASDV